MRVVVKENVEPKFKHDCRHCQFLGRLDNADLYVCFAFHDPIRIWVRRFDNGPENNSSLGEHAPPGTPYEFARQLFEMQERQTGLSRLANKHEWKTGV